ncbi:uncharacterized protein LOC142223720 [Haematobia irritans]|uniref:uncharacterized protein LOC142223720 n=1 Tax=Haematobia irritans TaxID=7368 RepID=UPI003F504838
MYHWIWQTIEIVEEDEKFYLMVFAIADITSGEVKNLIATDIASRGVAIEDKPMSSISSSEISKSIVTVLYLVIELDPIWGIASELIPIPEEAGQYIPSDSRPWLNLLLKPKNAVLKKHKFNRTQCGRVGVSYGGRSGGSRRYRY